MGDRILFAMFFQLLQLFVVLSCLRLSKVLNLRQICQARPQLMFLFWWDGLSLFDYLSMSVISQSGLKKPLILNSNIYPAQDGFSMLILGIFKRRLVAL